MQPKSLFVLVAALVVSGCSHSFRKTSIEFRDQVTGNPVLEGVIRFEKRYMIFDTGSGPVGGTLELGSLQAGDWTAEAGYSYTFTIDSPGYDLQQFGLNVPSHGSKTEGDWSSARITRKFPIFPERALGIRPKFGELEK